MELTFQPAENYSVKQGIRNKEKLHHHLKIVIFFNCINFSMMTVQMYQMEFGRSTKSFITL